MEKCYIIAANSPEKLGRLPDFKTISRTPKKYGGLPIFKISQNFPKISVENSVFR